MVPSIRADRVLACRTCMAPRSQALETNRTATGDKNPNSHTASILSPMCMKTKDGNSPNRGKITFHIDEKSIQTAPGRAAQAWLEASQKKSLELCRPPE